MADKYLSAYYDGNNANKVYLELHVYTIATSIANNTTTERADLYANVVDASYQWYNGYGTEAFIGINGNNTTKNVTFDYRSTGVKNLISSWDTVVKHNSNGTASIGISAHHYSGVGLGNASVSGTYTCDTIPRYANFTKHSINSKTETTVTVNWDADSECDAIQYSLNGGGWTTISGYPNYTITGLSAYTSYTIKTRIRRKDSQLWTESGALSVTTYQYPYVTTVGTTALTIGGSQTLTLYNPLKRSVSVYMYQNDTGIQLYSGTTNSTSITFTPNATTMYSSISSSQTGNCYYYCVYSGKIAAYKYGTYKIKGTEKPTFTNFSYADINSTTVALTGNNQKLISGYSNLQITIPTSSKATGNNSASISKYVATVAGTAKSANEVSGSTVTFGAYNKVKSNSMSVYAVDTRGLQSSTVSKTATLISYTKPVISSATNLKRVGGIGTDVSFNFSATFWNGNFGSVANTITKIEYARINATSNDWSSATWYTIPSERYTISGNTVKNTNGALLTGFVLGTAYKVRIRIIDKLDSNYLELSVNNGDIIVAFNKNKKMLGVGKIPSTTLIEGSIDVKGDIGMNGVRTLTKDENGSIYLCAINSQNLPPIVFRPNGINSGTGQAYFNTNGSLNLSNNISVTKDTTGQPKIEVNNGTVSAALMIGSGGTNRGLYDTKLGKWIVHNDDSNTYVNGYKINESSTRGVKSASAVTTLGWGTNNNYIADISMLAYWNGAYTNTNSNLKYCHEGTIQSKPTTLYSNAAGSNGTVTLSQSAANFNYLEIYCLRKDAFCVTQKVSSPNGKKVSFVGGRSTTEDGYGLLQFNTKIVQISGTTITSTVAGIGNIRDDNENWVNHTSNDLYIVRVEGYK